MLDVITIQARGLYKQHGYQQEAAHERVLRELHLAQADSPLSLPARVGQLATLVVAATVLLLAVALRPAAAPADAAVPTSLSTTTTAPAPVRTGGSDCWITGDLVGDANPATIAAAFCGR